MVLRLLDVVEKELARVEDILDRQEELEPLYNNEGNLILTVPQLVASYEWQIDKLREVRSYLRQALGIDKSPTEED